MSNPQTKDTDYIEYEFRKVKSLVAANDKAIIQQGVDQEVFSALATRVAQLAVASEEATAAMNDATKAFSEGLKATQEAWGLRELSLAALKESEAIQSSIGGTLFERAQTVARATMAAAYEVAELQKASLGNNKMRREPVAPWGILPEAMSSADAAIESASQALDDIGVATNSAYVASDAAYGVFREANNLLNCLAPNLETESFPIRSARALQKRKADIGGLLGGLLHRLIAATDRADKLADLLNQAEIGLKIATSDLTRGEAAATTAVAALSAAEDAIPPIPVASS